MEAKAQDKEEEEGGTWHHAQVELVGAAGVGGGGGDGGATAMAMSAILMNSCLVPKPEPVEFFVDGMLRIPTQSSSSSGPVSSTVVNSEESSAKRRRKLQPTCVVAGASPLATVAPVTYYPIIADPLLQGSDGAVISIQSGLAPRTATSAPQGLVPVFAVPATSSPTVAGGNRMIPNSEHPVAMQFFSADSNKQQRHGWKESGGVDHPKEDEDDDDDEPVSDSSPEE
ncbi:hypothetical protein ABZP36_027021 [Zizania latifolia]